VTNPNGEEIMFVIFATKPLNDGTKGFRFNIFGKKGLARLRKRKTTGWFKLSKMDTMNAYHFGRLIVYTESSRASRQLHHFAG
jgi:hypothetical protein